MDRVISRKARDKDLSQIKSLWKEAFGDTESFIDWNFMHNYDRENTFLQEIDGEIASVVQIIPHTLVADKEKLSVAYIWGMLTNKKQRGKGFARKSFEYILPEMYDRGYDISILTAAVNGMYEKFGYTTVCNAETYEEPAEYDEIALDNKDAVINSLSERYNAFVSHKKIYMERTYEYWKRVMGDICVGSKGKIGLTDKGYSLLYPDGDRFTSGELIETEGKRISSMPVMIRVVNAEVFAKKLAKYLKEDMRISIQDNFIKENNINILFKNGVASVCEQKGVNMSINEFGHMMINACGKDNEVYIKFPL